jgi:hypothetical protein
MAEEEMPKKIATMDKLFVEDIACVYLSHHFMIPGDCWPLFPESR